ncbi:MAG: aldehyde dehydrogenase family protein [bacterium]|nr:aldehyde dehydrogenase family protein [bacterium]
MAKKKKNEKKTYKELRAERLEKRAEDEAIEFARKVDVAKITPEYAKDLCQKQTQYFNHRLNYPIKEREKAVSFFSLNLKEFENQLVPAIAADLKISEFEAFLTEVAPVHYEFKCMNKNVRDWTRTRNHLPIMDRLIFKSTRFREVWQPIGATCVINSSRSPFAAAMIPAINLLAAGCTGTIKNPSHFERTNQIIEKIIGPVFKENCLKFTVGDESVDTAIAEAGFAKVYYTGPAEKRNAITAAAGKVGASVTMQLNGNNPVIVDHTADLRHAGKRIMWGKCIQGGRLRTAPSCVFAHESLYKPLINRMWEYVKSTYGDHPIDSPNCPKLFNKEEFRLALDIIDNVGSNDKLLFGGKYDAETLAVEPTCILVGSNNSPLLKKENVGPIILVLAYQDLREAVDTIFKRGSSPAMYLFTTNLKGNNYYCTEQLSFGSCCINDVLVQAMNRRTAHGGVAQSGSGMISGPFGLQSFGFYKTVATADRKKESFNYRYLPYPENWVGIGNSFKGMK